VYEDEERRRLLHTAIDLSFSPAAARLHSPAVGTQAQRKRAAGGRPGPLVAFVHIPKTAGGTVTSMFAGAYSKAGVRKTGNYMRGAEKAAKKIAKRPGGWESWHRRGGRVAVGHVPYSLFREHLPEGTLYMTFLREPVDRVLSHYYRHIHRPVPGKGKADSIEEALVELRLPEINNLATRFLCDRPAPGELPASALDEAKANLSGFGFVGIQERFEESVVLLSRTLSLDAVASENRHVSTVRPSVDEIPEAQRALIEEHNRLDVELYAYGRELFEEAVAAAANASFSAEVEALRGSSAAANEAYERSLADARAWLERELPPGTTKTHEALYASAAAAGFSDLLVKRAARLVGVTKAQDPDRRLTWTRSATS
jgi:Sulfotransferase family